jgi:hypothetical protein
MLELVAVLQAIGRGRGSDDDRLGLGDAGLNGGVDVVPVGLNGDSRRSTPVAGAGSGA